MNLGYSPLSAIDRQITPAPWLDKYFDKPVNNKPVKKLADANGGVEQTVKQMIDIVNTKYHEVERAKHLVKGKNIHETAKNIFDFLYKYIKYNLERGEILNSPAVSYWYGQIQARKHPGDTDDYPVDCDDFSIFAASFLKALGLPWAFRIASYDGVNYSHVYCIVPGTDEIIIDPVYYAFNKEKAYKKQKTYIGKSSKSNNLSGMEIYTQGISGLAGLGDTPADTDEDVLLLGYLNDNLRIARQNPHLLNQTYKNPYRFVGMLEEALKAIDTENEDETLDRLATQEQQMILSGTHSLSGVQGDDDDWYLDEDYTGNEPELSGLEYEYDNEGNRYFTSLEGFFGRLRFMRRLRNKRRVRKYARLQRKNPARAERYKKRYQRRAVRRVKRRKKFRRFAKNAVRFIAKVNPLTIAARNSLRALLSLNFLGLSTKLKQDKNAFSKLINWYKNAGGKESAIRKTIEKGARRKPLLKRKGKVSVSGFEGFGVIEDISSLAKTAGGIIKKIIQWLKERRQLKKAAKSKGISIKEARTQYKQGKLVLPKKPEKEHKFFNRVKDFVQQQVPQPANPATPEPVYSPRENGYPVNQANDNGNDRSFEPQTTQSSNNNLKKYGIYAAVIAVGAGAVYAINAATHKGATGDLKPLTGIKLT